MKISQKKVLILGFILLLTSCQKELPNKEEKDFVSLTDREIISFWQNGVAIDIGLEPCATKRMFKEKISPDNYELKKQQLWSLWKETNKENISKYLPQINTFGSADRIWELPQDEKMKLSFFKKGQKPTTGYPLIFNLHGGGIDNTPNGSLNEMEWQNICYFSKYVYKDEPSLYIVPRMSNDPKGRWYYLPQITAFKRAVKLMFLSDEIDSSMIYFTGFSEGGYGTLRLSLFMPDYMAGAAPLSGTERPNSTACNLRNIAFRVEVGSEDYDFQRNIFTYLWQDKMKELKKKAETNDFQSAIIIHDGKKHEEVPMTDATPWLKRFKRNRYPTHISYVYHNVTEGIETEKPIYSTGVYYLDFRGLKRSSNSDKIKFDIQKEGNRYIVKTENEHGKVEGTLGLFVDNIKIGEPVVVELNGKEVFNSIVNYNLGSIIESISLYGDPLRIFGIKIEIDL